MPAKGSPVEMPVISRRKIVFCVLLVGLFFAWLFFISSFSGVETRDSVKMSPEERRLLQKECDRGPKLRCLPACKYWDPSLPVIYVVTPTYARSVQKAELTRLSQTLMHVLNLHWIVVEDADDKTPLVKNFLERANLNYTHLVARTPVNYRRKGSPRGVEQRNAAIKWLRSHRSAQSRGVVYFADDDNSYAIQIFEEMRHTNEVSVWPVGLVGGLMVERPILNSTTGKVVDWSSAWRRDRAFPIDMAGFAVSLNHLINKSKALFSFNINGGFQESHFLQQLTTRDRLEPKAANCTQVLVWHTRTEHPKLNEESRLKVRGMRSDLGFELITNF